MAQYKVQYDIVRLLNGANFSCVLHPDDRVGFTQRRTAELALKKLERAHNELGQTDAKLTIVPILVCENNADDSEEEVEAEETGWN